MDTDSQKETDQLFEHIVLLTGLPRAQITSELEKILNRVDSDKSSMTMQDLRQAMVVYLMEVLGPMVEKKQ